MRVCIVDAGASVSARIRADVWFGLRGNMTMNPICAALAREAWGGP